jgi:hypothetical protein
MTGAACGTAPPRLQGRLAAASLFDAWAVQFASVRSRAAESRRLSRNDKHDIDVRSSRLPYYQCSAPSSAARPSVWGSGMHDNLGHIPCTKHGSSLRSQGAWSETSSYNIESCGSLLQKVPILAGLPPLSRTVLLVARCPSHTRDYSCCHSWAEGPGVNSCVLSSRGEVAGAAAAARP